jgi:hypothetical protein
MLKYTVGVRSIKNLILTAFAPVGSTMYIYGGGWNKDDNAGSEEARSIGLSDSWVKFASQQDSTYNHKDYDRSKDPTLIHKGMDCSAYVGWTVYNVLNDGRDYVTKSVNMGNMLAKRGLGSIIPTVKSPVQQAGDVMYGADNKSCHTYISLGTCFDNSVLLLHSSPPGVQLSGTATPEGDYNSDAIALATEYMRKYYPTWYMRYPENKRGAEYLTNYCLFRWTILEDKEVYREKRPNEILEDIFG